MQPQFNRNERLIRVKGVAQYLDCSVSYIWKLVQEDKLPKPYKMTPTTTVWKFSDIQDFIDKVTKTGTAESKQVAS